jgi:hypothetical protein
VLAAGAFGPGFPQPALAGHTGGAGLAPVTHLASTHATREALPQ